MTAVLVAKPALEEILREVELPQRVNSKPASRLREDRTASPGRQVLRWSAPTKVRPTPSLPIRLKMFRTRTNQVLLPTTTQVLGRLLPILQWPRHQTPVHPPRAALPAEMVLAVATVAAVEHSASRHVVKSPSRLLDQPSLRPRLIQLLRLLPPAKPRLKLVSSTTEPTSRHRRLEAATPVVAAVAGVLVAVAVEV